MLSQKKLSNELGREHFIVKGIYEVQQRNYVIFAQNQFLFVKYQEYKHVEDNYFRTFHKSHFAQILQRLHS